MNTIDYPKALDATDIETVVGEIKATSPAHEIRVHDAGTLHFGYWNKSENRFEAAPPRPTLSDASGGDAR